MARIERIRLQNYRSVGEITEVTFPAKSPVVLLGQNNAGKSNIVKGLGLVLGAFWAGSHDPEDHEFFGRTRETPIEISIRFEPDHLFGGRYRDVIWRYDDAAQEPVYFKGRPGPYGQADGFIRNDDRDTCVCVVLEADRNLRYHL